MTGILVVLLWALIVLLLWALMAIGALLGEVWSLREEVRCRDERIARFKALVNSQCRAVGLPPIYE